VGTQNAKTVMTDPSPRQRGRPTSTTRNCQTVPNIWTPRLTDRLTIGRNRTLTLTCQDSTLTSDTRSKEDQLQDKESQRAAYHQHGRDRLHSATQLLPGYASIAPARLSWLPQRQPTSSTAVFISPCDDPFQGQQRPTVCTA
jgi:hypothetical protein